MTDKPRLVSHSGLTYEDGVLRLEGPVSIPEAIRLLYQWAVTEMRLACKKWRAHYVKLTHREAAHEEARQKKGQGRMSFWLLMACRP